MNRPDGKLPYPNDESEIPETFEGTFFEIMDLIENYLKTKGILPYPGLGEFRSDTAGNIFHEMDEGEGSAVGREGSVGCITLQLYISRGDGTAARATLQFFSRESYDSNNQDNVYTYSISHQELDQRLQPYLRGETPPESDLR